MRYSLIFLICCLTCFSAFSLDTLKVKIQSKRLCELLTDYHFKPRDLSDESFGSDVHELLIDELDPNKRFFLQSQLDNIQQLVPTISEDFPKGKTRYLQLVFQEYELSIERALRILDGISLENSPIRSNEEFTFSENDSELESLWLESISLSAIEEFWDSDSPPSADSLAHCKKEKLEFYKSAIQQLKAQIDEGVASAYLNSLCNAYDPHTTYFTKEINTAFKEELSSNQSIFGISYGLNKEGKIEITSVFPGSSAWFSEDIEVGVELVRIKSDEQEVMLANQPLNALRDFFSKNKSDEIVLTIVKAGKEIEVELERTSVYSDSDIIKSAILEGEKKIGYIYLPDFYTNWTDSSSFGCANDIAKSIVKMKRKGIEGLVLDLRNNGGGSIVEAVELVGLFINFGPIVISQVDSSNVFTYKDFNRGAIYTDPLVVLVNHQSASASEIVAGALQDYNRAAIIGERTFGKATGQSVLPLDPLYDLENEFYQEENPDWGYVKMTQIGLYLPNKKSAQANGILPDVDLPHGLNAYREVDQKHVIHLDSVSKKIYFHPLEKSVQKASNNNPDLKEIVVLNDSIQELWMQRDLELDWKKARQITLDIESLLSRITSIESNTNFVFTANSTQFDPIILQLSPFLQEYNDRFLERLHSDVELNETYKTIVEIINN